jgi:hypothetical protein
MIIEYEEVYEDCYQKMVALFDKRDFTEEEALKEIKAQIYSPNLLTIPKSQYELVFRSLIKQ